MIGNWLSLKNSKPPYNKTVKVAFIPSGPGGNVEGWESKGWLLKSGYWSIKQAEGVVKYQTPTHYKFIEGF